MAKRNNRPPVKDASTKVVVEAKAEGKKKDKDKSSRSGAAGAQNEPGSASASSNAEGSNHASSSPSKGSDAKTKGAGAAETNSGGGGSEGAVNDGGSKSPSGDDREGGPGPASFLPVQFQLPFQGQDSTPPSSPPSTRSQSRKGDEGDLAKGKQEIMDSISNGLQEMVQHERGKLLKLRGELENINNPLGYQKFREEEQVKEEIIDALTAVLEARTSGTYSGKNSLEGILNTLKDDYEDTGKAIVSKALSRRRSRAKAISAIENELKRERRRHAKRQVKLVVFVASITYLINKMHRDVRFREKVVGSVKHIYSLWRVKVVPSCGLAFHWLNQRRKAIQWALGPQGALPSRKSSAVQLGSEEDVSVRSSSSAREDSKRRALSHGHRSKKSSQKEKAPHRRKFSQVRRKFEDHRGDGYDQEPNAAVPIGKGKKEGDLKCRSSAAERGEREMKSSLIHPHSKDEQEETDVFFSSFEKDDNEESLRKEKRKKLPTAFFCPITKDVMRYPVIAADGHTYEREAIKKWLNEHKTSPTTNLVLRHTHVIPNHSLKSAIEEFDFEDDK